MDRFDKILSMGIIACLIALGIFIGYLGMAKEYEVSWYYDLYYVKAPFGVLWVDVEGHFFFGSGGFDSELTESYIVKYFANNRDVESLTLYAQTTPITVDGTFQLEVTTRMRQYPLGEEEELGYGIALERLKRKYKIHLPFLPDATGNFTTIP